MDHCSYCLTPDAEWSCQCDMVYYCNTKCQEKDFEFHREYCSPIETESFDTIGKIVLPNQPPAKDISFRKRGFYKASVAKMRGLFRKDIFTWMCLMSFKTSPLINNILFQVKGDLTKLDQKYNGVVTGKPKTATMLKGERDPYSIFATFFKLALTQAVMLGRPLKNPKTGSVITKKRQLFEAFPSLRRPLTMRDKAAFVRLYVKALQNVIYSIPKLRVPLQTWRGYKPLNIPDSMSLDVRSMRVGQEITNWAFMSVSLDSRVSTLFMNPDAVCCMVTIMIPAGFSAFLISGDSGDPNFPKDITPWYQMEVLLPVGCVFRVAKLYPTAPLFDTTNRNEMVYSYMATLVLSGIRRIKTRR